MTAIVCRQDPYLKSLETQVTAVTETGFETAVTIFYPQGGGQPGDKGSAQFGDTAISLINSVKNETGDGVLHEVAEGDTLPIVGTAIKLELDWEQRHRFMRVHTALHLLCRVVGAGVTGGSIGAEKGRLDFDLEASPDKEALATELNRLIEEDHPVSYETISDEELDANPDLVRTMSVSPPRGSGLIRMVLIGSLETTIDYQPCGGTHVAATAEIGPVSIGKIEKKGKQNRRISLLLA